MYVCVVYRLPQSKKNKLLQDPSLSSRDFNMVSDTNVHLDKPTDHDVNKFLTLMDIFNFKQHVASSSQCSGHILEAVITNIIQYIVQDTTVGDIFSDHKIIVCKIFHQNPKPTCIWLPGHTTVVYLILPKHSTNTTKALSLAERWMTLQRTKECKLPTHASPSALASDCFVL